MLSKFLNFQPEGWTDLNGGKFGWSENFNEHPIANKFFFEFKRS